MLPRSDELRAGQRPRIDRLGVELAQGRHHDRLHGTSLPQENAARQRLLRLGAPRTWDAKDDLVTSARAAAPGGATHVPGLRRITIE